MMQQTTPMNQNVQVSASSNLQDGVSAEGDFLSVEDGDICVLPPSFNPGKWDVICQRGKECFEHVGNRRFRMTIDNHLDNYMKVKSRQQKSKIVSTIVEGIKQSVGKDGGGFVRKDLLTRRWFRVSDKLAREKVGQALRDAIKTRRASEKKETVNTVMQSKKEIHQQNMAKTDSMQFIFQPKESNLQEQNDTANSLITSFHNTGAQTNRPEALSLAMPMSGSRNFGNNNADIEPRPLSIPLNLGNFLSGNIGDAAFGDPSSTFFSARNQQWDVSAAAAAMLHQRSQQQDGLNDTNTIERQQQQQQQHQQPNIQSFALQPPPTPLFNSNNISNVTANYNFSHIGNLSNAAATGDGNGGRNVVPSVEYSFPSIDQRQQRMIPTVIGSRPLSLGGQGTDLNNNNNNPSEENPFGLGRSNLFNMSSSSGLGGALTNSFDVDTNIAFDLQKYAKQQQHQWQQQGQQHQQPAPSEQRKNSYM